MAGAKGGFSSRYIAKSSSKVRERILIKDMKAAVYYGPGDIRIENVSKPLSKENNLIAKVKCCSICGTDLKLATVGNPRCHPPRIIGHEMVGEIVHAGEAAKGFGKGDRITLATTIACGVCEYCKLQLGNICPSAKPISYDFDGAFAEYIEIPFEAIRGGNVIKVPDCVPDTAACLSEPISCAINAQELIAVKENDSVVIIGGGPLGAIHAELAKANGARDVMIVEINEDRLELLKRIKDVCLIDASKEDAVSIVRQRTGGLGADAAIVCAPAASAMENSVDFVRKGGSISLFASLPKDAAAINVDSRAIHYGELHLVGASDSRPEHVEKAIRLMAENKLDTEAIITHFISLKELHEGLELMKNRKSLKIVVYPQGAENEA